MEKRLFFRCNGGHYFTGTSHCPWDGWTTDGIPEAIAQYKATTDLAALRTMSEYLRKRTLVIEFGDPDAIYEALVPDRYIYGGREVLAGPAQGRGVLNVPLSLS